MTRVSCDSSLRKGSLLILLLHDLIIIGKAEVRTTRITAAHEARQIVLVEVDLALIVVERLVVVIVCAEFTATFSCHRITPFVL